MGGHDRGFSMHARPGLVVFLIIVTIGGCRHEPRNLPSNEIMTSIVHGDVQSLMQAIYSGDFAAVIDRAHPVIVKGLGGHDKALSTIEESITPILKRGIRVESLSFPKPPHFIVTDKEVFAIVPTLTVFESGGQRVESLNFQFGILDPDTEEWKYVEGSRINASNVRSLFPSFPSDYKFPEFYRKRL